MAEKKRQHYVPRFHLKLFSEDGVSINLFNIKTGKIIEKAAIKGQCQEDYFYGKDLKVETGLSLIEGRTSSVFNEIINGNIPERYAPEHNVIITFVDGQKCCAL